MYQWWAQKSNSLKDLKKKIYLLILCVSVSSLWIIITDATFFICFFNSLFDSLASYFIYLFIFLHSNNTLLLLLLLRPSWSTLMLRIFLSNKDSDEGECLSSSSTSCGQGLQEELMAACAILSKVDIRKPVCVCVGWKGGGGMSSRMRGRSLPPDLC